MKRLWPVFLIALLCLAPAPSPAPVMPIRNGRLTTNLDANGKAIVNLDIGASGLLPDTILDDFPSTRLTDFSGTGPTSAGQIPIWSGTQYVPGDPLVQGLYANASTSSANPIVIGGYDIAGSPAIRRETMANTTPAGTEYAFITRNIPSGTQTVAIAAGSAQVGHLEANQSVNVAQVNGVTPLMGAGNTGTGSQRVTIASDQPAIPVTESGTWTVQPGNTPNTTPWLVTQTPATSGGNSTFHLVSAATTNATNVKASAGQIYGYYIFNSNAASRKLAFHNSAGTPTAGASIFFTLVIPAGSGANAFLPNGIAFSTGIAITTVTGLADSDNTAVGANDLIINLFYK